jgi:hypothetical protein
MRSVGNPRSPAAHALPPPHLLTPSLPPPPPRPPAAPHPARLGGFGHRVYKTYDPRARMMKAICDELLEAYGVE